MTRVRALDTDGDWLFGKGANDYFQGNDAIMQNIKTRLSMFLGDCFFDLGAGIDWFNFLGSKNKTPLALAISATILNTAFVTGMLQLSLTLSSTRVLSIRYQVQTVYSRQSGVFNFNTALVNNA